MVVRATLRKETILARKLLRHWHQNHYRLRNGDLQTLPADAPPPAGGTLLGRFEHTDYLDDTTPPPLPTPTPAAPLAAAPPPGAILECYEGLDTLALATQQQRQLRDHGYVSPVTAPPSNTTRFLLTRPRQKPGAVPLAAPDTLAETVALQRRLGLRHDPAPTLTTNEACPCQRGARCTCPPDALREVAALQAAQQRAVEQARQDHGEWQPLRVMMSA